MVKKTGKKTAMKRICAWCNKVMQEGLEPATHGICSPCITKVMLEYESHQALIGRGVAAKP